MRSNSRDQCSDIFINDVPGNLEVDFEIGMHNPISETDDIGPRYLLMRVPGLIAYAGRGFADNFQDLEYHVLVQLALGKPLISETLRTLRAATSSSFLKYRHTRIASFIP